jgi:hypothetical protein
LLIYELRRQGNSIEQIQLSLFKKFNIKEPLTERNAAGAGCSLAEYAEIRDWLARLTFHELRVLVRCADVGSWSFPWPTNAPPTPGESYRRRRLRRARRLAAIAAEAEVKGDFNIVQRCAYTLARIWHNYLPDPFVSDVLANCVLRGDHPGLYNPP